VTSALHSHALPKLEIRAPEMPGGTAAPLVDREIMRVFREWVVQPSGVKEPTVLAINLEGRFPSASVLTELVVPLGQAARAQTLGPLAVVICTSDDGVREVLRALAERLELTLYVAPSPDRIVEAEPLGPLTPAEHQTLATLHRVGGRATVATFADAAGLTPSAATNRLTGVLAKGLVQRIDRSRRDGALFLDPRVASPGEDPADPTSGDFALPEPMRRDVQALAEMQGREPGAVLAAAWQEFLATHRDQLAADHRDLQDAMSRGDQGVMASISKRYAKKQARARADRLSG
jgi:hypothetical protein